MSTKNFMARLMASVAISAAAFTGAAQAQTYPDRSIRVIVPYAPGGATDIIARLVGKELSEAIGQSVIIENRSGGNTGIGASSVGRSQPDGYTLLFTNDATFVLNPSLFKTLTYDIDADLRPVGTICYLNLGLAVSANTPVTTMDELVQYIEQHPETLAYGSFGVGSHPHLMGEVYKQATSTDLTHVPYKGSAPAVVDLIGGQVLFTFPALATIKGHIEANRVKVLAISGEERSPLLPDVPTFIEVGYPDLNIGGWYGFFAPKDTPDEIVSQLNDTLAKILENPDFVEALIAQGTVPLKMSPEEMLERMEEESNRTKAIAEMASIEVD